MPTDAVKWRDEINKHGEVRYLINTEPHGDHTTGNCFFGGTVVAHEGTREAVLADSAEELKERGIETHEAVMVGDKPETDINPAHDRGFKTIQYTGFIDLGKSKADLVIHSFDELKEILKKKE